VSLSGKYVRSQMQIVVLFRTKVDQQIAIRFSSGVFRCFDGKLRLGVSGIFEENHVVRIQADGPGKFVFQKEVLRQVHDAHVFPAKSRR